MVSKQSRTGKRPRARNGCLPVRDLNPRQTLLLCVFHPFFRSDVTAARRPEGQGLWLWLAGRGGVGRLIDADRQPACQWIWASGLVRPRIAAAQPRPASADVRTPGRALGRALDRATSPGSPAPPRQASWPSGSLAAGVRPQGHGRACAGLRDGGRGRGREPRPDAASSTHARNNRGSVPHPRRDTYLLSRSK